MTGTDVATAKQATREHVWSLLERESVVEPGVRGHIPAFAGAEAAAERLAALPTWQPATVVKAVPDRAQLPVRARALAAGKLLYVAVPRLAAPLPFYELDPTTLEVLPDRAATSDTAASVGRNVGPEDMLPVDLLVCGSVAVNREGVRIGKGAGYSDIEFALLQEAGLISSTTTVVTTVHPLQVIGEPLARAEHDFTVDVIVTPDEVIACPRRRQPPGLLWNLLDAAKIAAIPALAALAARAP